METFCSYILEVKSTNFKMNAFLPLVVLLSVISVDASLEDICRRVPPPPGYDFCVTTLQAVPGSRNADVLGLEFMAINIVQATNTHNLAMARELLNSNLPANVKKALNDCVVIYDSDTSLINDSIGYIKSNDIFSAQVKLGAVEGDVVTCMDNWKEYNLKPMMVKENEYARNVSSLALGITYLLKK